MFDSIYQPTWWWTNESKKIMNNEQPLSNELGYVNATTIQKKYYMTLPLTPILFPRQIWERDRKKYWNATQAHTKNLTTKGFQRYGKRLHKKCIYQITFFLEEKNWNKIYFLHNKKRIGLKRLNVPWGWQKWWRISFSHSLLLLLVHTTNHLCVYLLHFF